MTIVLGIRNFIKYFNLNIQIEDERVLRKKKEQQHIRGLTRAFKGVNTCTPEYGSYTIL